MLTIMQISLFISFLSALVVNLAILILKKKNSSFANDHTTGPQKFHKIPTPHIGGLSIFFGVILGILFFVYYSKLNILDDQDKRLYKLFLIGLTPVFLAGFLEDLRKNISPIARLLCTATSAIFIFGTLGIKIQSSGIDLIDTYLQQYNLLSFLITITFISMITNAFNIIDGFNGLMLGYTILILLCILIISVSLDNSSVFFLTNIMLFSIAPLYIFNFPFGKIFSGDGGAYLIGFVMSTLPILLIHSNSQISPFFLVTIFSYPITEIVFSIYRKSIIRKRSSMSPDGLHFHMLVYKILTIQFQKNHLVRHAITSALVWGINLVPFYFCIFFWYSTISLILGFVLFVCIYLSIYFILLNKKLAFFKNHV